MSLGQLLGFNNTLLCLPTFNSLPVFIEDGFLIGLPSFFPNLATCPLIDRPTL